MAPTWNPAGRVGALGVSAVGTAETKVGASGTGGWVVERAVHRPRSAAFAPVRSPEATRLPLERRTGYFALSATICGYGTDSAVSPEGQVAGDRTRVHNCAQFSVLSAQCTMSA